MAKALDWVEAHGPELAVIGRDRDGSERHVEVMLLAELATRVGSGRLSALITWLGDERLYRTPMSGGAESVDAIIADLTEKKRPCLPPARPAVSGNAQPFFEWVRWLSCQDRSTAQRALRLFDLTSPGELLSAWDRWWIDLDRVCISVSTSRLTRLRKSVPATLDCQVYVQCLQSEANPGARARFRAIVANLQGLPAGLSTWQITRFFMHWAWLARREDIRSHRIPSYLDAFRDHVTRSTRPYADSLHPWSRLFDRAAGERLRKPTIDTEILYELDNPGDIRCFFNALGLVTAAARTGIDEDAAEILVELVEHTREAEKSAALFMELKRADQLDGGFYGIWASAIALTAEDTGSFTSVLRRLKRALDTESGGFDELLRRMIETFTAAGELGILRRMVAGGEGRRVIMAGRRWALLRATRRQEGCNPSRPIPLDRVPGWAREYPASIHPSICRLAAIHAQPEQAVVSIVGKNLPRKSELQRELEALAGRAASDDVAAERIRKRVANLQSRLEGFKELGAGRLAKLVGKLEAAADRAIFDNWEGEVRRRIVQVIPTLVGVDEVPPWAEDQRHVSILSAIAELRRTHRTLGMRLLRVRCGPGPWDLRDAEANQRFLETLIGRSIELKPWIDGIGVQSAEIDGVRFHLSLEDDPLEIFHMGGHFNTCLSPGSFNFFSVLANVADINKRVLYARDDRGRVHGRTLLALTDQGGIVTFYCYCHAQQKEFKALARGFVAELADRMRTVVVPSGKVSNLVASKWYDDGPVDLGGQFDFLAEEAGFRGGLATMAPAEFVASLTSAFAPLELNELTLPLVLALPEVQARPELMEALLPSIRRCPRSMDETLAGIAVSLVERGETKLGQLVFGERAKGYLLRIGWPRHGVLELLAERSPSDALDVLRRTRDRSIRAWDQETDGRLLIVAAQAHEALHRRKKAIGLYQRALDSNADEETRQVARDGINRLKGGL